MVSTTKVCRCGLNIFFADCQQKPFQQGKYCSDIRISTDYAGCYPPHNVYFSDMQINRWRNFKDKRHLFTLDLPMTTKIRRISPLIYLFISLDKSVLLNGRCCLMSKFPEILILLCRKICCFLFDFSRNFFIQLWFCCYIRFDLLFKNLISSRSTLLQEAFLFNLD